MSEEQNLDTQEVQEPTETRDIVAREFEKLEQAEQAETEQSVEKRDEKGRFKPKQAEPQEEKPEVAKEAPTEEKEETPKTEQERNPFAAWKKPAQEALRALPPETQQYIVEREQQFHKGIQQYKEDAHKGRTLGNAIAPHMEYLQQLQVAPEVAVSKLIETERRLRTSDPETKAKEFVRLAHDYGIDINSLTNVQFDPYHHNLEQRLAQQQAALEQITQSRQMAEQAQLGQTIEQFAQTHEHFDEVRETMADLLDKGFASDLNDAYAKAVRLNDDVFSRVSQQPTQQINPIQRANEAAKAAKASAVSVKGSPTGVTRAPEPKTTEEAVRQAMANLGL
jgi:hypothetical protein